MSFTHDSTFIINDIELSIPPTSIQITKHAFNHEWQTLRTRASQKTKSGHAVLNVSIAVTFIGHDDINNKLIPLIAQLRLTPFCYVHNEFLYQNIFPKERIDIAIGGNSVPETIALAFREGVITVSDKSSVEGGNPAITAVEVQLSFSYFNYHVYCPFFQFLKDKEALLNGGTAGVVSSPGESELWREFYFPRLQEHQSLIADLKPEAIIQFIEFTKAPRSKGNELAAQIEILEKLASDPEPFVNFFTRNIGGNAQDTILQAARATGFLTDFSGSLGDITELVKILEYMGPEHYRRTIEQGGNVETGGVKLDKQQLKDAIDNLKKQKTDRQEFEQSQSALNNVSFIEVKELSDDEPGGLAIFKRVRALTLKPEQGAIIREITVSIRNILATLPVLGHKYATFQHIGSMDASVTMNINITNDAKNEEISWFWDTVEWNMNKFRNIPQGLQAIRITNDFLQAMGLREFITSDCNVTTNPGQPGTYTASLTLVESGIGSKDGSTESAEEFKVEYVEADPGLDNKIIQALLKYTKFLHKTTNKDKFYLPSEQIKNFYAATPELDPLRDSTLIDLATRAATGMTTFLQEMRIDCAIHRNRVTLFKESEEVVPGISKLQNVLAAEFAVEKPNFIDPENSVNTISNVAYLSKHPGTASFTKDLQKAFEKAVRDGKESDFYRKVANEEFITIIDTSLQEGFYLGKKNLGRDARFLDEQQLELKKLELQNLKKYKEGEGPVTGGYGVEGFLGDLGEQGVGQALLNAATPSSQVSEQANILRNSQFVLTPITQFKSVQNWYKFMRTLSTEIRDSGKLDLIPELKDAAALERKLGLRHGLPAYPDFPLVDIARKLEVTDLVGLDPDFYFFKPTDTALGKLDTMLIKQAQDIAYASYNNARKNIDTHFRDGWIGYLPDGVQQRILAAGLPKEIPQKKTAGKEAAKSAEKK